VTAHDRRMVPREARLRLDSIPDLVRAELARRDVTMRKASLDMGLSASTLTRVVQGQWPDLGGFLAIVSWLGVPADWFVSGADRAPVDAYARGWNDCAAVVWPRWSLVPRRRLSGDRRLASSVARSASRRTVQAHPRGTGSGRLQHRLAARAAN
jgi:lambda repressor-like predicted transcriptional regulator